MRNNFIHTVILILFTFAVPRWAVAQQPPVFTRADTLRGTVTPERAWWDLAYYHLQIRVTPRDSTVSGSTTISYRVLQPAQTLQVDLQAPLRITKVEQDGQPLTFRQDGNAYFVALTKPQQAGRRESLVVHYAGKPQVAKNAPWDGGFSWQRDTTGKPFVATSCQGLGDSAWWPCKDPMYEEPDSMLISVPVPRVVMNV
ncbi:MAG: M1 family peptidase, partial [Cytophagales bacterium]|nr:M1 family peptidase [Cytophagales bacterium]